MGKKSFGILHKNFRDYPEGNPDTLPFQSNRVPTWPIVRILHRPQGLCSCALSLKQWWLLLLKTVQTGHEGLDALRELRPCSGRHTMTCWEVSALCAWQT